MKSTLSILLFCFLMFLSGSIHAQQKNTIQGVIVEETTREPVQFANAVVYRTSDSSLVNGVFSDGSGKFEITEVSAGKFFVLFVMIGFENAHSRDFELSDSTGVWNLDTIPMRVSKEVLGEVRITDEHAVSENSIDRKVYNVDKDVMSTSGSASDVLGNVPSITVDVDGTVRLRGSANVTIFINGKPSPLMKVNAAAALQSIPANTIERIEVITNPSAKFKPDGAAGIINIVLKKETKTGFNGILSANVSTQSRVNSTLTMNYGFKKVNLFGSYGYRQDHRERLSTDSRSIYDSTGILQQDYLNTRTAIAQPRSHTAEIGLDYLPNKSNTFGISGNYYYEGFRRNESTITLIHDSSSSVSNDYQRQRIDNEYEWDHEFGLSYDHLFPKEDEELSIEYNWAHHFEQENNKYNTRFTTPALKESFDNTTIAQYERQQDAAIEYVLPIGEDMELETGYAWEYLAQHFDFAGEYLDSTSNLWAADVAKTNQFDFSQSVHAAYATFSMEIEDFAWMAGLRAEQAYIYTRLVNFDSVNHNNYFRLYPTLHLSYSLSDYSELGLSYSKRIERPEGDELNPFSEYRDPRNIQAGNPNLKPQQIHSLEFGYEYKKGDVSVVSDIYYKYLYDGFTEISRYIDDSTLLTTSENLSSSQSAGVEFIFSYKFRKLFTLNLNANGFYNVIDASDLGFSETRAAFSGDGKIGLNVNCTQTTFLQLNANFRTAELTPQGRYLPGYFVNAGMKQDLFKKRASLQFTVSDIFNSQKWREEIDTPELKQTVISKRQSQLFYLGFTWYFGKSADKRAEELRFDNKM